MKLPRNAYVVGLWVVMSLINSSPALAQVQRVELAQVLAGEPLERILVQRGHALDRGAVSAHDGWQSFE